MSKFIIFSLIVALSYSGWISYIHFTQKPQYEVKTIIIPGDTVFTEKIVIKPVPYKVEVPTEIPITITDTNCMEEYVKLYKYCESTNYYKDTLQNDTSMTIIVESIVNGNNLDNIKLYSKNNRSIQINNIICNKLYKYEVGVIVGKELNLYGAYSITDKININGLYNIKTNIPSIGISYKF